MPRLDRNRSLIHRNHAYTPSSFSVSHSVVSSYARRSSPSVSTPRFFLFVPSFPRSLVFSPSLFLKYLHTHMLSTLTHARTRSYTFNTTTLPLPLKPCSQQQHLPSLHAHDYALTIHSSIHLLPSSKQKNKIKINRMRQVGSSSQDE